MNVIGYIPPDEKWLKMKAVWDSCEAAGVHPPENVMKFFNFQKPTSLGVEVDLEKNGVLEPINEDYKEGYIVNLKHLKTAYPFITHIKFYNSY